MSSFGQKQPQQQLGLGTGVEVVRMDRPQLHLDSPYRSPWAAKKANPRLARQPDPALHHRLNREAAILSSLSHPGIIGFRGVTQDSGSGAAALLMQLGGRSLMDRIEERRDSELGPFSTEFVGSVLTQAAEALRYLHGERRLMHGDLKCANMLLTDDDPEMRLRLCDFGSALPLGGDLLVPEGAANEFKGTELWAAPEVLNGSRIGHKADMWSLGMAAYELLSLDVPHGDIFQELDDDQQDAEDNHAEDSSEFSLADGSLDAKLSARLGTRPPLPQLPASYAGLVAVFRDLTAADPADRPSAAELLHRMRSFAF